MLDIEDIFDKINTTIQSYPLHPSSCNTDENSHCIFCYYSLDVYHPPPPHDHTKNLLDNIKCLEKSYPAGYLLYYVPETILCLWKKPQYFC